MNARYKTHFLILAASLGYFVDIYDLILFSVVRVPSLKDLGLSGADLLDQGLLLLNLQMTGMLVGGLIFGILGDRLGRVSVLFASILLYSLANFANAFVHDIWLYAFLRFVAGFGLAGELGAGVTLLTETLSTRSRGWGPTIVTSFGVTGALVAWEVSRIFSWRTAFIVGGVMGLALLGLRLGVMESQLFHDVKKKNISRGNWLFLIKTFDRCKRFFALILLGLPTWYAVGILMTLAPEFAGALHISGTVEGGRAIFFFYSGLIGGDLASGLISQVLRSRKKSLAISLTFFAVFIGVFFLAREWTADSFYYLCLAMGVAGGYWAMFVTIAAEQFGTNLRATVAISIPNFARGSLVPLSALFIILKGSYGLLPAGATLGFFVLSAAFTSLFLLRETYGVEMDSLEE